MAIKLTRFSDTIRREVVQMLGRELLGIRHPGDRAEEDEPGSLCLDMSKKSQNAMANGNHRQGLSRVVKGCQGLSRELLFQRRADA